ncbi:MAG: hypothetical protein U0414_24020 [Polyangiaceae bacterium]
MRVVRSICALVLATALWLSLLHFAFRTSAEATARPLAARLLRRWQAGSPLGSKDVTTLRRTNPEWDLMARTFTALTFANLAIGARAPGPYVDAIDRIADVTIAEVESGGALRFLLPYAERAPFVDPAGRSVFVDGEVALMLAARELVAPDPARAALADVWVTRAREQIELGPKLLAESYPDEGWIFCNTVALAATRLHDVARGEPNAHAELFARWVARARAERVDADTGLLVSKTGLDGTTREGPEGSTIWLAADMLLLVDEDFAREQFQRARAELAGSLLGFAWSREWPVRQPGREDVDSGPTIPLVGANAGASGLAIVAARAFGDDALLSGLLASLEFAGFPLDGGAHFAAGNLLADAVIAYGTTCGPLWKLAGVGTRGAP